MQEVSRGLRCHIGIFGRRNVGKSSLMNLITRQHVSIVSEQAGTTTDSVEKAMEFLPLGPVVFIDTAGIDDEGALGALRIEKTRRVFMRTDLAILVTEANVWTRFEEELMEEFKRREIPVIIALNKTDLYAVDQSIVEHCGEKRCVALSTKNQNSIQALRKVILNSLPENFFDSCELVKDLLGTKEIVIFVIPIDNEAPRGRLLLPQVQVIRDALDGHAISLIIREEELQATLDSLAVVPKLVVTDSSIFHRVKDRVPAHISLTSFSILFSRLKGNLPVQAMGALAIKHLVPGDRVLISESCTHHPIGDDIGRNKIPRWLSEYVGGSLAIDIIQGHDFPDNLSSYKLVILCGSCMFNRREVLNRIVLCQDAGVPCTNYGLAIALCSDIWERVLEPFPDLLKLLQTDCHGQ